jgi:hypothetical protein
VFCAPELDIDSCVANLVYVIILALLGLGVVESIFLYLHDELKGRCGCSSTSERMNTRSADRTIDKSSP